MDPRLKLRSRQKASKGPLKSKFEAAILEIMAAFKKTTGFQHAQTKGNERELPVRALFKENLPDAFAAVGGEIIDTRGSHSRQTDVIIFNRLKNKAFTGGGSYILAAEAALVTIEVKTTLNANEIATSIESAKQLKSLRLLGKPLATARTAGSPAGDRFRFFHCIFAYNTDLTENDWIKKEYARLDEICLSKHVPTNIIDRLYVADRGLIIPEKAIGMTESPQSGEALMQFLLHATNFCLREDRRRPPVEYVNYASTAVNAWQKLR